MSSTGTATMNFGLKPGTNVVETIVAGATGILANSHVEAWMMGSLTTRSGTGDSITFTTGTGSLVDAAGTFVAADISGSLFISGSTNSINNGYFTLTNIGSATTVSFINSAGITETSSFVWTLMDGHNAYEHATVPVKLTCGSIVANTSFVITATTEYRLTGKFLVHWVWA